MQANDQDSTFFEKERDKLAGEIASGFEHLLTSTNVLNRKLEEVCGMTKEYDTIASLWARFHALVRTHDPSPNNPHASTSSLPDNSATNVPRSGRAGGLAASSSMREDESLVVPLHDQTMLANPPTGLPGTGGYKFQVPPSARKVIDD